MVFADARFFAKEGECVGFVEWRVEDARRY